MGNRQGGFLYADDEVLQGVTLALKRVDRDAKKEWARSMRTQGTRVWRSAIRQRTRIPQDRIFGRGSVRWSMTGKGTAKVTTRALSGGLGDGTNVRGGRDWALIDFGGANPRLPARNPRGRVVHGAIEPFGSWMGQMAVRTLADTIREAVNVDE